MGPITGGGGHNYKFIYLRSVWNLFLARLSMPGTHFRGSSFVSSPLSHQFVASEDHFPFGNDAGCSACRSNECLPTAFSGYDTGGLLAGESRTIIST